MNNRKKRQRQNIVLDCDLSFGHRHRHRHRHDDDDDDDDVDKDVLILMRASEVLSLGYQGVSSSSRVPMMLTLKSKSTSSPPSPMAIAGVRFVPPPLAAFPSGWGNVYNNMKGVSMRRSGGTGGAATLRRTSDRMHEKLVANPSKHEILSSNCVARPATSCARTLRFLAGGKEAW